MALVHADDFGIYGGNASYMLNGVYAEMDQVTLVSDPSGSGRPCVRMNSGVPISPGRLRKVFQSPHPTVGQAGRFWLNELPSSNAIRPQYFSFRNGANAEIVVIQVTNTGRISAATGAGTILGTTSNPVITANALYHVEAKVVINGVSGSVEVRVEGRPVLVLTDVDLGTAPIAQVAVYNRGNDFGAGVLQYFLDYVVWDGSGTQNTDFMGTVIVGPLLVNEDVNLNWTPNGAATGAAILSGAPPADATRYLSAGDPPPAPYVGSLTDLPDDVTSVRGLVLLTRAAKNDGGDALLQSGLISDPLDDPETVLGANRPITVVPTYWTDIFEIDPKTNAAWTPTAVDNAQLQINRTA